MNLKDSTDYIFKHPEIVTDMFDLICGDYVGGGTFRDVYAYQLDDKFVVKIENPQAQGDNWAEWRLWHAVKHHTDGSAKMFAECTWISPGGRILLQRRTQPLHTKPKLIPEKIPAYFTDIKEANFGWIGNQLTCHDYSHCLEMFAGQGSYKKMQMFKKNLELLL
jgi:hypothetical protein